MDIMDIHSQQVSRHCWHKCNPLDLVTYILQEESDQLMLLRRVRTWIAQGVWRCSCGASLKLLNLPRFYPQMCLKIISWKFRNLSNISSRFFWFWGFVSMKFTFILNRPPSCNSAWPLVWCHCDLCDLAGREESADHEVHSRTLQMERWSKMIQDDSYCLQVLAVFRCFQCQLLIVRRKVWAWLWASRECDGKTPKLLEAVSHGAGTLKPKHFSISMS